MTFFLALLFFFTIADENQNPFLGGIESYQAQKYDQAEIKFKELIEVHPENPTLLFNFGLTQYQLGNPGLALGLWRKARALDSRFVPADAAIAFAEEKLSPDSSVPSALQSVYRSLKKISIHIWLLLFFLSGLIFLWLAITHGVRNKTPFTQWPAWLFTLIPIGLTSMCFSIILILDQSQMKATIIEKNILTHTNPSIESPTISELQEGQVVNIEKSYGDWIQIRTLSGAAGWVSKKSLIFF